MAELTIEKLNGKREPLADRLPLACPLSVSVTTANCCNLKCEFCSIADPRHLRNQPFMELETFRTAVRNMVESHWHLKQLVLVGLGEPLLNKDIVSFVDIAKRADIADKIHIVSNGVLLTPRLSDQLFDAGLDVLRISINGLSSDEYLKYAGKSIEFDELLENLRYFYMNKPQTVKSYIKIMDYMVDGEEKKRQFENLFGGICDVLNVEHLTEMSTDMDYKEIADINNSIGLKGFEANAVSICPLPFYHPYLNADGTFSACCIAGPWTTPPALVMGNTLETSLSEIWNHGKYLTFLKKMLQDGRIMADDACRQCKAYKSYVYPEDVLDTKRQFLLERYSKL